MAISFGGLGNGVDFGQVVTELVKVQRQPIDKLTAAKTGPAEKTHRLRTAGNKTSRASERGEPATPGQQLRPINQHRK